MGGLGSGNFRAHMTTVKNCFCLDLLPLVWLRAVQTGTRSQGILCWPASARREHASTIGYEVDMRGTPGMRLTYGYQHLDDATPAEQIEQITYQVRLVTTAQHYGGSKWWFACLLARPGRTACGKRVRQLYLPPGRKYFGCRHCYALTYASRQHRGAAVVCEWPALVIERADVAEQRVQDALRRGVEGRQQKRTKAERR